MIIKKIFRGLRGGLVFETTFPFRQEEEDFWSFVDRSFLFSAIGLVVGSLLGGLGVLLSRIPSFIGASLFMVGLYLICGILHTDGLADFADGLVTGGTHSERKAVMKDEKTGAAGLITILVTNLLLFSGLVELFSEGRVIFVLLTIISAEVLSKGAMLSLLFFGKSAHEGMGSTFIEKTGPVDWIIGMAISSGVLVFFRSPLVLIPVGVTAVAGFVFLILGNRVIGGINGDIVGAVGEVVRPLALVAFVMLSRIDMPAFVQALRGIF